jgi:hypothetical protein
LTSAFDEHYQMAFGKRPAEELYLVSEDPDCVRNVARDPKYAVIKRRLLENMEEKLRGEGDPRMLGRADFFDTIEYVGPKRHSYDNWLRRHRPEPGPAPLP